MLRRLFFLACLLFLSACSSSDAERLISFNCEDLLSKQEKYKTTLAKIDKALEEADSLPAYHNEEMPWVFDKKTGDLYEYDDFNESFAPVKDFDTSSDSDPYNKKWMEFSSYLSKDGSQLKIKAVSKVKNVLLGERVELEEMQYYNIEKNTLVRDVGESTERIEKCRLIATDGIDVQWLESEKA